MEEIFSYNFCKFTELNNIPTTLVWPTRSTIQASSLVLITEITIFFCYKLFIFEMKLELIRNHTYKNPNSNMQRPYFFLGGLPSLINYIHYIYSNIYINRLMRSKRTRRRAGRRKSILTLHKEHPGSMPPSHPFIETELWIWIEVS